METGVTDYGMTTQVEAPTLFAQQPNFSDAINRNLIQSEIEGGVDLRRVSPGTVLEVQTRNHVYRIVSEQDGGPEESLTAETRIETHFD